MRQLSVSTVSVVTLWNAIKNLNVELPVTMSGKCGFFEEEEEGRQGLRCPIEAPALRELEQKYWALRKPRKAVRYTACVAFLAQIAPAICCFVASSWGEAADSKQRLRFTGSVLLVTLAAGCLLISVASLVVTWVSSCRARVGNALFYLGSHAQAILYSALACATACALFKTIGLRSSPLSLGASIAACCVALLQALLQPIPLGGCWAVCAAGVLVFLSGTQQLLSSLSHGALPGGFFLFAGRSYLLWLFPLAAAALIAAALLLAHYIEMLIAASRKGYYVFCPPNSGLYSLDALNADAAAGRPLSLSPRDSPVLPPAPVLAQLFAAEISPRRLAAAMAQQRRTVASPNAAAPAVAQSVAAAPAVDTPRENSGCSKGAWLVALWLRGPFLLAALGFLCVALSLLLLAVAADSVAAKRFGQHNAAAFGELANLLLPQQQQQHHHHHTDLLFAFLGERQQQRGVPLTPHQPQQKQEELLALQGTRRRPRREKRLPTPRPAQFREAAALMEDSFLEASAPAVAASDRELLRMESWAPADPSSSLNLRNHPEGTGDAGGARQHATAELQMQKAAEALLLLAMALLLPLIGTSLGHWVEDLFFGYMVLIKRNSLTIIPPPVLHVDSLKPAADAATPRAGICSAMLPLSEEEEALLRRTEESDYTRRQQRNKQTAVSSN